MPVVEPQTCRMELDPDGVRVVLQGQRLEPSPYRPDWARCAQQGPVVLIVGLDPWSGREADLDPYLARARRIRVGLVSATQQ